MMEEKSTVAVPGLELIDGITYLPGIESVLVMDSGTDFRLDYDLDPVTIDTYKVAPWGHDNLLPNHLLKRIGGNDIVSANLKFNRDVCYGLGPKLIRVLKREKGRIVDYKEVKYIVRKILSDLVFRISPKFITTLQKNAL